MTQGLRKAYRALRPSDLAAAALGMGLLALGLRQWTRVAFSREAISARSPLPYGAQVTLPNGLDSLANASHWVVTARETSDAKICEQARGSPTSLTVMLLSDSILRVSKCASTTVRRIPLRVARALDTTVAQGFLVVSPRGRVYYGSYDLAYLPRMLPSLSLLPASRGL